MIQVQMLGPYPPPHDGIADYTERLVQSLNVVASDVRVSRIPFRDPRRISPFARKRERRVVESPPPPHIAHVQFSLASAGGGLFQIYSRMRRMRRHGVRIIVTMHEVVRDTQTLPMVGPLIYQKFAQLADAVIVHTEAARARLTTGLGVEQQKVNVIGHPLVDVPAATCSSVDLRSRYNLGQHFVVLAFGFIHVDKGLDVLAKAIAGLSSKERDGILILVAGAVRRRTGLFRIMELPDRFHLRIVKRFLHARHLQDSFRFIGFVQPGEVRAVFEAADLVVLPYRRIDESGVAATVQRLNRPVLAARVGGLAERFADENLFTGGSAHDLQRALSAILQVGHARLTATPARESSRVMNAAPDVSGEIPEINNAPARATRIVTQEMAGLAVATLYRSVVGLADESGPGAADA